MQLAELRQQLRTLTAEVDAAERRTLSSSSMLALPFLALVALLVTRMQMTPALVPDLRHALSQAVQFKVSALPSALTCAVRRFVPLGGARNERLSGAEAKMNEGCKQLEVKTNMREVCMNRVIENHRDEDNRRNANNHYSFGVLWRFSWGASW